MKSVYAIGGMGAVGCLLLSFMMQHLLKVQREEGCGPVAQELAELAEGNLVGRAEVRVVQVQGLRTLVVRVGTRAGVDRRKFAASTGKLLWRTALAMREPPRRMRFEVADAGGAPLETVVVDPPGLSELRRPGATAPPAPPRSRHE